MTILLCYCIKINKTNSRQLFNHPPDQIRKLLDDVRNIRNHLAHLREITPIQRDQLLHCKKLLDRISLPADWQKFSQDTPNEPHEQQAEQHDEATPIVPTDEETLPGESRYSPLADWLNSQPGGTDTVKLTFEQIEKLIGGLLPTSAYEHRSWWANDSQGHSHSQLWLEVGWRAGYRNIAGKIITFVRTKGREKAYIEFFGSLIHQLRKDDKVPVGDASPDGTSWIVVVHEAQSTVFGFSFTRGKRFRVELYIDTGNQETTKEIFDRLYSKKEIIESSIGHLSWERLDEKRASRIAFYHAGHITDPERKMEALQQWAVEFMPRLYNTLSPLLHEATSEVL